MNKNFSKFAFVILFVFILILSFGLVSANWFSDLFGKTTGQVIDESSSDFCEGCIVPNEFGTEYGGRCLDSGFRFSLNETNSFYCDIAGTIKSQKTEALAICQNNFECGSNMCSSGKCVDVAELTNQAKGTISFVTRALCRLSNPFFAEGYNNCLAGDVNNTPTIINNTFTNETTFDGGIITFDSFGRIIEINYANNSLDISYSYYGDTLNIKQMNLGNGAEVYTYDPQGNLVFESYRDTPELNKAYSYDASARLTKVANPESNVQFGYDSLGRVVSETTFHSLNNKFNQIKYEYDAKDRVTKKISPLKTVDYIYNLQDLLSQEKETFYDGQFMEVDYEYDTNGNIIKMKDNKDNEISYSYETISYDCNEAKCLDADCITYTFVASTCSYDQLKSRTIGGLTTEIIYDEGDESIYRSTFLGGASTSYTPIAKFDSKGLLTEDDYFNYAYDSDMNPILTENKLAAQNPTADLAWDKEGLLEKTDYNNGVYETYYYDALGRLFASKSSTGASSDASSGRSLAMILPFISKITGYVVSSDSSEIISYSLEPGNSEESVTNSEFDSIVGNYEKSQGDIQASVKQQEKIDSQCAVLTNPSFVKYKTNYFANSCVNDKKLKEYYCGKTFFRLDFWNFNEDKAMAKKVSCSNGCYNGACVFENSSVLGE